jgi:hypothetical protein
MTGEWLKKLPADLSLEGSKHLMHNLKEFQERLNQNPDHSSRPPTRQPPWAKTVGSEEPLCVRLVVARIGSQERVRRGEETDGEIRTSGEGFGAGEAAAAGERGDRRGPGSRAEE